MSKKTDSFDEDILKEMIKNLDNLSELENKITGDKNDGPLNEITRCSPEWQEYILNHFVEGEIIEINGKKCPTAFGLERVTNLLVGQVFNQRVVDVIHLNTPIPKVVVTYEIEIELYDWVGKTKTIRDLASVSECNTDDLFLGYAEETACTRAKGRCFKNALGYNGVSFEELTREKNVAESVRKIKAIEEKVTDGSFNEKEEITDRQSKFIAKVSKELNIELSKYIEYVKMEHGNKILNNIQIIMDEGIPMVKGISKSDASDYIIKPFNTYKQDAKNIPQLVLKRD